MKDKLAKDPLHPSSFRLHPFPKRLIVFVKAPQLGVVKTRLAKSIGEPEALTAYHLLVGTLLDHLEVISEVEIRFSPDAAIDEIRPWLRQPGWTAVPQGAGDLGKRLVNAFHDAFSGEASQVVVIGSDCAEVIPDDIRTAWEKLQTNDLVLGPAADGGYWLIGLRQPAPFLFNGISWSTETVCQETMTKAQDAGLKIHLLRQLEDVDTGREWQQFLQTRNRS